MSIQSRRQNIRDSIELATMLANIVGSISSQLHLYSELIDRPEIFPKLKAVLNRQELYSLVFTVFSTFYRSRQTLSNLEHVNQDLTTLTGVIIHNMNIDSRPDDSKFQLAIGRPEGPNIEPLFEVNGVQTGESIFVQLLSIPDQTIGEMYFENN